VTVRIDSRILGIFPKRIAVCDRCGEKVHRSDTIVCARCFARDPTAIRLSEFLDSPYFMSDRDFMSKRTKVCCRLCGDRVPRPVARDLCRMCRSRHADNTHLFWDHYTRPEPGKTRFNSCASCGGLQIVLGTGERTWDYKYYQTGSSEPTTRPFACTDDLAGTNAKQRTCRDEWLVVHDDTISEVDGKRKLNAMRQTSRGVLNLLDVSDLDLQYAAFGSKRFWCVRCGAFFNLNPQREQLLPKAGMPKGY
jgi:hypothetical protein